MDEGKTRRYQADLCTFLHIFLIFPHSHCTLPKPFIYISLNKASGGRPGRLVKLSQDSKLLPYNPVSTILRFNFTWPCDQLVTWMSSMRPQTKAAHFTAHWISSLCGLSKQSKSTQMHLHLPTNTEFWQLS